jgi:hypothetical protein
MCSGSAPTWTRPLNTADQRHKLTPVIDKSLSWLVEEYYRNYAEFKAYDDETKKVRRNILKALCNEPVQPGSTDLVGELEELSPNLGDGRTGQAAAVVG